MNPSESCLDSSCCTSRKGVSNPMRFLINQDLIKRSHNQETDCIQRIVVYDHSEFESSVVRQANDAFKKHNNLQVNTVRDRLSALGDDIISARKELEEMEKLLDNLLSELSTEAPTNRSENRKIRSLELEIETKMKHIDTLTSRKAALMTKLSTLEKATSIHESNFCEMGKKEDEQAVSGTRPLFQKALDIHKSHPTTHVHKEKRRKNNYREISKFAKFKQNDDANVDVFQERLKRQRRMNLLEKQLAKEHSVSSFFTDLVCFYDHSGSIWCRLFDYQRKGVSWLWSLHQKGCGGIVGDEMGLGKTIQIIALLAGLHHSKVEDKSHRSYLSACNSSSEAQQDFLGLGPTLIVCPATVLRQWMSEFHSWWPPIRVAILHSTGSGYRKPINLIQSISNTPGSVLLTTYATLVAYRDVLTSRHWSYIILDEGHKIKNPEAEATLAVKHIFPALILLRNLCNHPDLATGGPRDSCFLNEEFEADKQGIEDVCLSYSWSKFGCPRRSSKMLVVASLLKNWFDQGHKVLLFSQSRRMLTLLERLVQLMEFSYLRMDGTTPVSQRHELIRRFNYHIFIFLLTTRVGGLGVNLTSANRVLIYDPDWNPTTDLQARERAWRIGQLRDVIVYRLLTSGTIEEKIYHRQIFKQFLTNRILKNPRQQRFFKTNDLQELLSFQDGSEMQTPETALYLQSEGMGHTLTSSSASDNRFDIRARKLKDDPAQNNLPDLDTESPCSVRSYSASEQDYPSVSSSVTGKRSIIDQDTRDEASRIANEALKNIQKFYKSNEIKSKQPTERNLDYTKKSSSMQTSKTKHSNHRDNYLSSRVSSSSAEATSYRSTPFICQVTQIIQHDQLLEEMTNPNHIDVSFDQLRANRLASRAITELQEEVNRWQQSNLSSFQNNEHSVHGITYPFGQAKNRFLWNPAESTSFSYMQLLQSSNEFGDTTQSGYHANTAKSHVRFSSELLFNLIRLRKISRDDHSSISSESVNAVLDRSIQRLCAELIRILSGSNFVTKAGLNKTVTALHFRSLLKQLAVRNRSKRDRYPPDLHSRGRLDDMWILRDKFRSIASYLSMHLGAAERLDQPNSSSV
ncbi:unnamed protein product [Heterobilharzia americana]|nr:unnamed protein product [Heterobilharzia americana]